MPDTKPPVPLAQNKIVQAVAGVALLLVMGVAGGSFLGFKVQPEECAQASTDLAVCEARMELVGEALDDAREAIGDLAAECD